MTAKGLFWMFAGPAVWMAILLLIASDKAHDVAAATTAETDPGAPIAAEIADGAVQPATVRVRESEPTCLAIDVRPLAHPETTRIRTAWTAHTRLDWPLRCVGRLGTQFTNRVRRCGSGPGAT